MTHLYLKSKTLFLTILFFSIFGLAKNSQAATIHAASCSQADVQAAIGAASNGDTVTFSGNCTWMAYHNGLPDEQFYAVIINKPVTLQGIGNPVITHGDQRPAGSPDIVMIFIQPTEEHINDLVRVTGIYFENIVFSPSCNANLYTPDISVSGARKFRLDHNTFHNGKDPLRTSRWSNGVIDSNFFDDTDLAIRPADDADYYNLRPTTDAWARPLKPGSADFVFIENNTFTTSNKTGCSGINEYLYHHNGARAVSRYNTMTNYCVEYNMSGYDPVDAHGLPGCDRGSVLQEIYNNKFEFAGGPLVAWFNLRGGSFLIHDNTINTQARAEQIRLWNEGDWNNPYYAGDTVWPSRDQINNSFFWDNKSNGLPTTVEYNRPNSACTSNAVMWGDTSMTCCTVAGTGTCDDFFVQEGRDYFMEIPKASGQGYVKWGTVLPGDTGDKGGKNAIFVPGASAYYPYTPYTCPHPLTGLTGTCDTSMAGVAGYNVRGGDTTAPAPPSGLVVN